MLMSHALMSAGSAATPRFGRENGGDSSVRLVAHELIRPARTSTPATRSGVDILYAPVSAERPRRDRIVVKARVDRVSRQPRCACGLHVTFFVGRTALQYRGCAIPFPRQ